MYMYMYEHIYIKCFPLKISLMVLVLTWKMITVMIIKNHSTVYFSKDPFPSNSDQALWLAGGFSQLAVRGHMRAVHCSVPSCNPIPFYLGTRSHWVVQAGIEFVIFSFSFRVAGIAACASAAGR